MAVKISVVGARGNVLFHTLLKCTRMPGVPSLKRVSCVCWLVAARSAAGPECCVLEVARLGQSTERYCVRVPHPVRVLCGLVAWAVIVPECLSVAVQCGATLLCFRCAGQGR